MPAVDENIPIRIKNTFVPEVPGTLISRRNPDTTVQRENSDFDYRSDAGFR